MNKCIHGYPGDICWNCNPEILKELHRVYPINMEKLAKMAERNPKIKELYQDVCCLWSVDLDWDAIFQIARDLDKNAGVA